MVSVLCIFSVHVHAVAIADHEWAPIDMEAAFRLQVIIRVHAVPRARATWYNTWLLIELTH